jgi:hypothetical protein
MNAKHNTQDSIVNEDRHQNITVSSLFRSLLELYHIYLLGFELRIQHRVHFVVSRFSLLYCYEYSFNFIKLGINRSGSLGGLEGLGGFTE